MTTCTLKEIREAIGSKATVWGGIPSISLLDSSMDDVSFEDYLNKMFNEFGTGEHLVLGVSDNVPPEANLSRFKKIEQKIKAFGSTVQQGKTNE